MGFPGDPVADADNDGNPALLEYALGTSDDDASMHPVELDIIEYTIDGITKSYLTASFLVNQHAINSYDIVAEIGSDLVGWSSSDIALVSDLDNGDGTSTRTYRSLISEEDHLEEKEFIRVRVTELP